MSYEEIIRDIDAHLQKSDKEYYSDFYIGVTSDVKERLHNGHGVPEKGHWFITRGSTDQVCRDVERYYLDKGMKGDQGGGHNVNCVYCYEIGPNTRE